MFCGKCGKQLKDGNLFCTECGEKANPSNDEVLNDKGVSNHQRPSMKEIRSSLIGNTDIMKVQNEKFGFTISSFGYDIDPDRITGFVEITAIKGKSIDGDFDVKMSLFDAQGNLLCVKSDYIDGDEFAGLCSCEFYFNIDEIAYTAKTAKVYITKS